MSEWRPSATREVLRRRAELLAALRVFFAEREVLEVETPVLCSTGSTDPHLAQFSTQYLPPGAMAGRPRFLQTSPEFCMKRLLAAGSGPIYQIGKCFRNGEAGRRHNPEFTMLEWYRPGYDHHTLMDEVDALLQRILNVPAAERVPYGTLCERHLDIDPHYATLSELRTCASRLNVSVSDALGDDREAWLQLLWTHVVEPHLARAGRPLFVVDYPASQAMLARLRPGTPVVAERFELYVDGMELANGFHELTDAAEQSDRFVKDRQYRELHGLPAVEMDARLLAALKHGLPACSGVALGVDRLMMVLVGTRDIAEVLAFPHDRC